MSANCFSLWLVVVSILIAIYESNPLTEYKGWTEYQGHLCNPLQCNATASAINLTFVKFNKKIMFRVALIHLYSNLLGSQFVLLQYYLVLMRPVSFTKIVFIVVLDSIYCTGVSFHCVHPLHVDLTSAPSDLSCIRTLSFSLFAKQEKRHLKTLRTTQNNSHEKNHAHHGQIRT